jgi:S1-C subfamily serine protease
MRILVAAVAFLAALAGRADAEDRVVPQSPAQVQLSFAPVVSKVAPAVVNVYARRVVRQAVDPFFQQFFGANPMRSRVEQSLGSGAVTAEIARGLGLQRPEGVLISQVYPGSPAAQAGLVKGDVVLSIDGFAIADSNALRYRVVTHRPGDNASIRFWRSGAARDATVRIALPPDQGREEGVIAGQNPMQGARVANITPALADDMQMDLMAKGVVVLAVDGASQAARFGFQQGDVVRQINGERIAGVAELKRALTGVDEWNIAIQRGDRVLQLAVQ